MVYDLITGAITKQGASASNGVAQLKAGSSVGLRAPTSECPTNQDWLLITTRNAQGILQDT